MINQAPLKTAKSMWKIFCCKKETSDQIIIHVDTNDLATNVTTEKIAEFIAHLASTLKSNSCSVFISKISERSEKHRKKVEQVNWHLEKLCKVKTLN